MNPKNLPEGQINSKIRSILMLKITTNTLVKFFLVALIFTFGTMSAYAIVTTATKEPITLIGLGLMALVAASTYIKN
mgnify:CR=1 FL=1